MALERAAVVGAGVMGAGIAAHLANAGVSVLLLDIVPAKGPRNAIAEGAVQRLLKTDPAPLMHKSFAGRITPGNVEDDLPRLADADWVVEAVIEDPAIKRALYARLAGIVGEETIVSSNTSTIPLAVLTEGMPESLARRFLITHFFNPPRYMRLLEVVAGPETAPEVVERLVDFADRALGKGVVPAKDTPGFIANRIGAFWIQSAVNAAFDMGLAVEEADAVMGKPVGIPKTGVFGLIDLVGLDLQPYVGRSLCARLPESDPFRQSYREPELMARLIAEGYTGRKGKGGFYRRREVDGKRIKEAIDLATGTWRPVIEPRLESVDQARYGLRSLVTCPDKGGRYAWRVLSETLGYAASLVPEIADEVVAVDEAMRLGYAWKKGPFELIDSLGAAWFASRLAEEGRPVPPLLERAREGGFYRVEAGKLCQLLPDGGYRPVARRPGVLLLSDIKRRTRPVARNGSASLWDVGDGVLCLEFHTKMNALDQNSLAMIEEAVRIVGESHKALVIYNEASHFSAGANIGFALFAANIALWDAIEEMVAAGQRAYKKLKYAPFPVVGAPSGLALGGGCEILLHCDAVQAHAETYMGLVETGVGLVPAWGGCGEMLARFSAPGSRGPRGPMAAVGKVFEIVGRATVSRSAYEAKDYLYLRADDRITFNRERLLADAKSFALALADGYRPPEEPRLKPPGATGRAALALMVEGLARAGKVTPHDRTVAKKLAYVLTGGDLKRRDGLAEEDIMGLERQVFMELVREPATLARMEHTLETGRPLRN